MTESVKYYKGNGCIVRLETMIDDNGFKIYDTTKFKSSPISNVDYVRFKSIIFDNNGLTETTEDEYNKVKEAYEH